MKRTQKIERLSEEIFAPLSTEETKMVGGGATGSVTATYTGRADGSASVDFTF
jgi:hypothetical protein